MNQHPDWGTFANKKRIAGHGIKAKSRRGDIGESWWSKRFTQALEGLQLGGRLARGRTYARQGQVLEIKVEPGQVRTQVQGSRKRPYRVEIAMRVFDDEQWKAVEAQLASQALFAAKLLGGEMPADIEGVFEDEGLALMPRNSADLVSTCSCPDWVNPCKHIAASLYLLAEEFDDDPFLILQWRGRSRDVLLANLSAARQDVGVVDGGQASSTDGGGPLAGLQLPDLGEDFASFYQVGEGFEDVHVMPTASSNRSGLVQQDVTPIARTTIAELLSPLYEYFTASAAGMALSDPGYRTDLTESEL